MPLQQDLYNGLSALRTIPFLHGSERKHGNGLAHMDTRWSIPVPSWLAYGQRGSGDEVPLARNRHWDEQWAGQGENMMPLLQAQLPWA